MENYYNDGESAYLMKLKISPTWRGRLFFYITIRFTLRLRPYEYEIPHLWRQHLCNLLHRHPFNELWCSRSSRDLFIRKFHSSPFNCSVIGSGCRLSMISCTWSSISFLMRAELQKADLLQFLFAIIKTFPITSASLSEFAVPRNDACDEVFCQNFPHTQWRWDIFCPQFRAPVTTIGISIPS